MSARRALVIGASAGGVAALVELLPRLPATCTAAVLVVQHLLAERPSLLAGLLAARCRLPVREAEDKEPVLAGTVYIAPPNYHLQVDRGPQVVLSVDPPVAWSRPSIDVLFETAADVFAAQLTALVLTGASDDGAAGLAAVARAGGRAIVQDPAEAEVPTMPRAALARVPGAEVMGLAAIGELLSGW